MLGCEVGWTLTVVSKGVRIVVPMGSSLAVEMVAKKVVKMAVLTVVAMAATIECEKVAWKAAKWAALTAECLATRKALAWVEMTGNWMAVPMVELTAASMA